MKTKKRFDMHTLATLATTATSTPESISQEAELIEYPGPVAVEVLVEKAINPVEKYRDIALKCLRKLQTQNEHNLESGGYDPSGARVLIADWITECARSGISSHRLNQVKSIILKTVVIENSYIRELTDCQKEEPSKSVEKEVAPVSRVDLVHQQLSNAISGIPVTLKEVLASPLFDEFDLDQISKGNMNREALRMYIGSWLVADRNLPCVLHQDWWDILELRKKD